MAKVFLSIGGNIGDRLLYLSKSRKYIENTVGTIVAKSSVIETDAWGYNDRNKYLNQVVKIETNFKPCTILELTQEIEKKLGRKEKTKKERTGKFVYSARTIDIDILFFEEKIIQTKNLIIPHPRLHERDFVMIPLNEIAPDFIHPVFRKKISKLNNSKNSCKFV